MSEKKKPVFEYRVGVKTEQEIKAVYTLAPNATEAIKSVVKMGLSSERIVDVIVWRRWNKDEGWVMTDLALLFEN